MRTLRLARGNTKKEDIRNEDNWGEAYMEQIATFIRKRQLRWDGRVLKKEEENTTKKMSIPCKCREGEEG